MKIKNFIGIMLATLAFFWIIGTVGALEWDNITFVQAVIQGGLGILVGWAGLKLVDIGVE